MPVNLKDEIAEDGEPVIDNTINDDRAIAGGGEGSVLAGLYHILRQLGQSGMRTEKLGTSKDGKSLIRRGRIML